MIYWLNAKHHVTRKSDELELGERFRKFQDLFHMSMEMNSISGNEVKNSIVWISHCTNPEKVLLFVFSIRYDYHAYLPSNKVIRFCGWVEILDYINLVWGLHVV